MVCPCYWKGTTLCIPVGGCPAGGSDWPAALAATGHIHCGKTLEGYRAARTLRGDQAAYFHRPFEGMRRKSPPPPPGPVVCDACQKRIYRAVRPAAAPVVATPATAETAGDGDSVCGSGCHNCKKTFKSKSPLQYRLLVANENLVWSCSTCYRAALGRGTGGIKPGGGKRGAGGLSPINHYFNYYPATLAAVAASEPRFMLCRLLFCGGLVAGARHRWRRAGQKAASAPKNGLWKKRVPQRRGLC